MTSKLTRWLDRATVRESLAEASGYLGETSGRAVDLAAFLAKHPRPHNVDFDLTLVALTAVQLGIARSLPGDLHWDVVLGCSHGDIARSVLCEIVSFRQAVVLLATFAELRKTCPQGVSANLRTVDGTPLLAAHKAWALEQGVSMSVWSDTHATIAGTTATIDSMAELARHRGLKVKPTLPYPVHSEVMRPSADALRRLAGDWPLQPSRWPVFSSVWVRYLEGPPDYREEALATVVEPVRWTEALASLHRQGVRHIVNVGPSNTLTSWMLESPAFAAIDVVDAWDLVHAA
jgi:[acyl-carrier-protein] S-malonyltransferase